MAEQLGPKVSDHERDDARDALSPKIEAKDDFETDQHPEIAGIKDGEIIKTKQIPVDFEEAKGDDWARLNRFLCKI